MTAANKNTVRLLRMLFFANGIYYLVTGLWPLLHISSFMFVTGPKTDLWLVKMVGLLAASTGVCLLYSFRQKEYPKAIVLLAILNALSFMAIDVYYVLAGAIRPVYLLDAVPELLMMSAYLYCFLKAPDRHVPA
jgi:hypothetical protein